MQEIPGLIVCEQCDAVYRKSVLTKNEFAYCLQCGVLLERHSGPQLAYLLPLTIAGLILFIVANCFPIVELQLQGAHTKTTLFGTVISLFADHNPLVALVVLITTLVFPFLQLLFLLLMTLPQRGIKSSNALSLSVRLLRAVQPWSMLEVFMLGVLVAIIKLASLASIIIGVALWAFLALVIVLGFLVSFDTRQLLQHTFKINKPNETLPT